MTSNIVFKNITKNNWCNFIDLQINQKDKNYLTPNYYSIIEHFYQKNSFIKGIYLNSKPIGFIKYNIYPKYIHLDKFMIDKNFQGKGYGKKSFNKLMKFLLKIKNKIKLTTLNPIALKLYESYGFIKKDKMKTSLYMNKIKVKEYLLEYN